MYVIDDEKCNGCANCMDVCDVGAIYLVDNKAEINQTQCTACGVCVDVCPTHAIRVEPAVIQQHQTSISPSLKQSIVSAIKSTAVTLGSTLIPIAISRIGDLIATKFNNRGNLSSSTNQNFRVKGKRFRRKYRGGIKKD